jgi:DNA-damage-inducible protein J
MNTHTILNIKTDKKLKAEAKKVSEELGIPLSTVINAFLKKFIREKEITLSANPLRPTPYLEQILEDAQTEHQTGKSRVFKNGDEMLKHLKSL